MNASDFQHMHVPSLKGFLTERGITCSLYRKQHLVRLCEIAVELDLEVVDTKDDYKDMDLSRRTINLNGSTYIIPEVTSIQDIDWTSDLREMSMLESYNIVIYLMQVCQWNESRLSNYKNDNGFKLFTSNQIHDVSLYKIDTRDYFYLKSSFISETRQSEKPYMTWLIVRSDGHVKSGGCTCVV